MVARTRASGVRFLPISLFWGVAAGCVLALNLATLPGRLPQPVIEFGAGLSALVAACLVASRVTGPYLWAPGRPGVSWAIGWLIVGNAAGVAAVLVGVAIVYADGYIAAFQSGVAGFSDLLAGLWILPIMLGVTLPIALIEASLLASITLPLALVARTWLCRGEASDERSTCSRQDG